MRVRCGWPSARASAERPKQSERAGAVTLNDDVGLRAELFEPGSAGRIGDGRVWRSARRAPVDRLDGDLREAGRLQAEHVGTPAGERPGGDGPGDHPRQVEDARAGSRPTGSQAPDGSRARGHGDGVEEREAADGHTLRVLGPFMASAHGEADTTGVGERGLEALTQPTADGSLNRLGLPATPEDGERPIPVPRIVGGEAKPAVGRAPEPREGMEDLLSGVARPAS